MRMELSTNCISSGSPRLTALDSLCYQHLAQLLGLNSRNSDFSVLLSYSRKMAKVAFPEAWAQCSFVQEYARKMDLDLNLVFAKLLRENATVPLNPAIFGHSPAALNMPPLVFPLLPISQRANEITIVSGVPGLNRLLQMQDFWCLNEFWGVERVNAVWAEPVHLREAIRKASPQIGFNPDSTISIRDTRNGGVPWIALDAIPPSDKINQWFSPALQRKYGSVPVYAGKRNLTLAVAKLLDPRLKAEIEGALRHRFTIQQVLADEAALKRFVTASESRAINTSGIVQAMLAVERAGRGSENLEVIQAEKLHQSGGRSREDEQAVIKFVHSILYKG